VPSLEQPYGLRQIVRAAYFKCLSRIDDFSQHREAPGLGTQRHAARLRSASTFPTGPRRLACPHRFGRPAVRSAFTFLKDSMLARQSPVRARRLAGAAGEVKYPRTDFQTSDRNTDRIGGSAGRGTLGASLRCRFKVSILHEFDRPSSPRT